MILENVHVVGKNEKRSIHVHGGVIKAIANDVSLLQAAKETRIDFNGALAFPGLINSHDHLDFNLFPSLKNRTYNSYTEWGADIHQQNKDVINEVQKVPAKLSLQWGIYKNLLNGITTVINHGEIHVAGDNLITVFQNCYDLHSPRFEKNWKLKLNRLFRSDKPFVIHIGEGTNADAEKETDEVIQANFFKRKIIAVHGVSMSEKQAASFHALVWCPYSNYFLLNKTSDIKNLKKTVAVVFGSDSTLTSSWNFWDHIRCGLNTGMISQNELFEMLTINPAKVWQLGNSGSIEKDMNADIVIASSETGDKDLNDFFQLNPENILMVMHKGNIRLVDERIINQLTGDIFDSNKFSCIKMNTAKKYVQGDLTGLVNTIRKYYPGADIPFTVI